MINRDLGYVSQPAQFEFLDGIFALAATARDAGLAIHVVTNQSGIGRGHYTEADFAALSTWMAARFAEAGITIAAVHFCPDHPEHGIGLYRRHSVRRKPGPGMMLDAAAAHGLDLPGSVMIGDKATDMQAALAAGIGVRILLSTDAAEIALAPPGGQVAPSLAAACRLLQASVAP